MSISKLLIANRGEIAVRVLRAARQLGLPAVTLSPEDDRMSLHILLADESVVIEGRGTAAYLSIESMIAAAKATGCNALHPGYGFLAENAELARRCAHENIVFVGPSPEALDLFGDKAASRRFASETGAPLLPGTKGATSLDEVRAFRDAQGGADIILKALAGGGGRGIRRVGAADDLEEAFTRCESEALAAFGNGALYVERYVTHARHIEVQILGDAMGSIVSIGDRECSLQRRHQKLVEIAPAPFLAPSVRERIRETAVELATAAEYRGLGTFEFLLDAQTGEDFWFMEANPRIQVEHTVTEEAFGVDLVGAQLRVASGASLAELSLGREPAAAGYALQLRVNAETIGENGSVRPASGTIRAYEMPAGPGVRIDGAGYTGYTVGPSYDSLLAKLIVAVRGITDDAGYEAVIAKAGNVLRECRIDGIATNLGFLAAIVARAEVRKGCIHTGFIQDHGESLLAEATAFEQANRPVAVQVPASGAAQVETPEGTEALRALMVGVVIALQVEAGDAVVPGQTIAVLEAMKMEHLVVAETGGIVHSIPVGVSDLVQEGDPVAFIEPSDEIVSVVQAGSETDLDEIRPDLAEVVERHQVVLDHRRPEAVARRRKTGQRTVRENIADLCDDGSFVEYGALTLAARRTTMSVADLIETSPADGLVTGLASINGASFGPGRSRAMVIGYDYTVFAGTQGITNHKKMDRMFDLAKAQRLPMILLAEGGGGRPGDTDKIGVAGLETATFTRFAQLSGKAPLVGVVSGRCFAGNAALLGCCDVIIATANATIGMGGPAMIEGGGLGVYKPEEVGPMSVQVPNGVVDVAVSDEAEAIDVARRYLSYFQGPVADWTCCDQRTLRHLIPTNRLRSYDVRAVIAAIADGGSFLELRAGFGQPIVTGLIRVEGRPMGLVANNPRHLGGAIDSPASDKAARFLQLCDAHGLPILSLTDTPGFMVGPDSEKTAAVRHVSRIFMVAANRRVPLFSVVLRKAYGLGAMAMAGGDAHSAVFQVAWPTGEYGPMGLEGSVRLGQRRHLEAIADPVAREAEFQRLVAERYEAGKAINAASLMELDDVIDPAETRRWIITGLDAVPPIASEGARFIDTW
jgi:acetyl/propionyl-CoA carboxylase alpha subunit/acetyl-CoA carboxylase carboxyltransferase component